MKRMHLAAALALGLSAGTAVAQPQPQPQAPAHGVAQVISVTATVEKVDTSKRELTLRGPEGNHFIVQVPESVQRLDNLKPGDQLAVDFYQSVALTMKKQPGPVAAEARTFAARPTGNLPSGMMGQEIDATAKVIKVDANKGMLMIEGPAGQKDTIQVQDPQMKSDLKKLKPGDGVEVTYTQALAISALKKS